MFGDSEASGRGWQILFGFITFSVGIVTLSLNGRRPTLLNNMVSDAELWEQLSEPEAAIRFVAEHHRESSPDSENILTDDLFYPMSCSEYDDDTLYPNDLCIAGDNATCHESVFSNPHYSHACASACDDGWGVPCGWQAVRQLPNTCHDMFEPIMPTDSKNEPPAEAYLHQLTVESTNRTYWACNVHAFCYWCVEDKNVNNFCKAAVMRTKSLYAPAAVFKYMDDYWCDDKILNQIENGTYCGYSSDKNEEYCSDERDHSRR